MANDLFADLLAKYGLTLETLVASLQTIATNNPAVAGYITGALIPFFQSYGSTTAVGLAATNAINEFVALFNTGSGPVDPQPVDVS